MVDKSPGSPEPEHDQSSTKLTCLAMIAGSAQTYMKAFQLSCAQIGLEPTCAQIASEHNLPANDPTATWARIQLFCYRILYFQFTDIQVLSIY